MVADGTIFADLNDPGRFGATNIELIGLDSVARRTAARLGLSVENVEESVVITPAGQSDVAKVTASAPSPSSAARLANAYADTYIRVRENADHLLIRRNIGLLRREFGDLSGADRTDLAGDLIQDRINRLELIDDVELGGVQVVDRATPPSEQASPKPVRNGLIGLAVGALLGVAFALLLERLERRLKRPEDVEAAFDGPPIARIPASDALLPATTDGAQLGEREAEALKSMRTHVRHAGPGAGASSVLVTSAVRGEGRTTIAWDLAAISAGLGLSVLLLEADLHNPALADAFGFSDQRGLAQVLAGEASFEEVIRPIDASRLVRFGQGGGSVDLLTAGQASADSIDLVDGKRMHDLIPRLQERYDLVVIDSPAAADSDDVIPLAKIASGVVVVGRLGVLRRRSARALSEQLRMVGVRPLGVVVNFAGKATQPRGEESSRELVAAEPR